VKNISAFFKSIGNFLNHSEEYFDNRIKTGKFVDDIKFIFRTLSYAVSKVLISLLTKGVHSQYYIDSSLFLKKKWQSVMKLHPFAYTATMFFDACKIFITYYADIFIVFAISFPSVILLLNFFQNSQIAFFIALIPVLFCNVILLSSLYYVIDKRDHSTKVSLWKALSLMLRKAFILSKVLLFHISIFTLLCISYALITLFFRFFFDAIAVPWSGSFIYWFVIIFIGLFCLIGLLTLNVIVHQAYFMMVLESKSFEEAFGASMSFIKSYAAQFSAFYLIIYIFCTALVYWATLYYLYFGFAVSIFFFALASMHIGFLLRRRFYNLSTIQAINISKNHLHIFGIIILFGLLNYALVSVVITKQFYYITRVIETQRDRYFLSQELTRYTNTLYKFIIEYPKNWSVYEWRGSSVTFYNNYTGTLTGGIWLNISVSPYDEQEFLRLYNAGPGLVSLDNSTNDFTTKVSNISVQGYEGVNYITFTEKEPYPEYKTHYRFKKDNYFYDLTFTTLDKNVEGNNTDLFERIVSSFRFIK
jgi:hypothetical protein